MAENNIISPRSAANNSILRGFDLHQLNSDRTRLSTEQAQDKLQSSLVEPIENKEQNIKGSGA
jgi:hypothetical protein